MVALAPWIFGLAGAGVAGVGAGVLPVTYAWGTPITADFVDPNVGVPAHVSQRKW